MNWRILLLNFRQCSSQNALNGGVITALTAINYCPIAGKLLNFVAYSHRIQDTNFYETCPLIAKNQEKTLFGLTV
jgi:hypothetical protein